MRTATVSIVVLAYGVLTLAIPPPSSLDRFTDSEISSKVEEAARSLPVNVVLSDDNLRGLTDRMDFVEDDTRRFFHSEPEEPAHHGWAPPPAPHEGIGLVGPFAFQLGAYYNPYIPVPMNQGYSSPPAAYGSPAPKPYTVQKAPSYPSSSPATYTMSTYTTTSAPPTNYESSSYTTAAPSYDSSSSYGSYSTSDSSYSSPSSYGSSYSTAAPTSYGNSYTPSQAPIILGYTASASYPQGYGSSSSYSRSGH